MTDFLNHFKTISNTPHDHINVDNQPVSLDDTVNIEQLDTPFSVDEINKTISSLNRNKSADCCNNVADFFIESNSFISPYLCLIFNKIYESGTYPDSWCNGVIVPIHKKGDVLNPSN